MKGNEKEAPKNVVHIHIYNTNKRATAIENEFVTMLACVSHDDGRWLLTIGC